MCKTSTNTVYYRRSVRSAYVVHKHELLVHTNGLNVLLYLYVGLFLEPTLHSAILSLTVPPFDMSTDILTRDSISGEAPLSCRDTFGLWGRTPMKWQNSESSNFTDYNCAVPSCNNYPSVLASCCSSYVEDLHQFNTTVGPLFSCALDEAKTEETYQEYQNCLLRHLVDPFKCNDPGPDTPTVDGCDGQVIEPPQSPGLDEQICSMRASSNATRALVSCCSGAGTNGTGIISLDSGCNVACISDSAEMQDCLSETLSNPTQGGAITCHTGKGLEGSQDSAENTSQSTYVGVQVMLVGGAGLLAVSLLL